MAGGFTDLIEALTILRKYGDPRNPTFCGHDVLIICDIEPKDVSDEDKGRLDELGFFVDVGYGGPCFMSYRFGSA
jgi:hypothetical protein